MSDSETSNNEGLLEESEVVLDRSSTSLLSSSSCSQQGETELSVDWPIRESLFPFIPPYIVFSSHDTKVSRSLPTGARYLKWKLSTITPILIRKTLTNSGFRMV